MLAVRTIHIPWSNTPMSNLTKTLFGDVTITPRPGGPERIKFRDSKFVIAGQVHVPIMSSDMTIVADLRFGPGSGDDKSYKLRATMPGTTSTGRSRQIVITSAETREYFRDKVEQALIKWDGTKPLTLQCVREYKRPDTDVAKAGSKSGESLAGIDINAYDVDGNPIGGDTSGEPAGQPSVAAAKSASGQLTPASAKPAAK